MAFWKREGKRVIVYVSRGGKQAKLPRDQTRHLDTEPDHNIEAWVTNWSLAHERAKPQTVELTDSDVLQLVDDFLAHLAEDGRSPKTISQHKLNLTRYCLPYFVNAEGLTQPVLWPTKSGKLRDHLRAQGAGARTINACNVSMRVFWEWLGKDHTHHTGGQTLHLWNAPGGSKKTPLRQHVSPDELLRRPYPSPILRLMALIGYFFSLRPQELVAVREIQFRAGSKAEGLECCKVMGRSGLYDKFALHVDKQRVGNDLTEPKASSEGWVACFNEQAAREIIKLLQQTRDQPLRRRNEHGPVYRRTITDYVFRWRLDWWFKVWAKHGWPDNLKDLRRASVYWLGHHTSLELPALQNHARHADPATTALYYRRAGEQAGEYEELDLDA